MSQGGAQECDLYAPGGVRETIWLLGTLILSAKWRHHENSPSGGTEGCGLHPLGGATMNEYPF